MDLLGQNHAVLVRASSHFMGC